jgi:hypothetical protein
LGIPEYEYRVEECDVPKVRQAALTEYRTLRRKCLEYIHGPADTSITNQFYDLTWHTAVFRTLNEARRIEPRRSVNGTFWELTTAGYANLMTSGIRKLVDKDRRTDSIWNVITLVERRPELLTRENFICYDGLPYDYDAVQRDHIASLDLSGGGHVSWIPTKGPKAWGTSEIMHRAFDRLSGYPKKRRRSDTIQPSILVALKKRLSHPAIVKVRTMADRRVAHAERISEQSDAVPIATYNDIDSALQQIVRVANTFSSLFFDTTFTSVVATPQFNVLKGLDQPWVTRKNIPTLHKYWDELCASMDAWANAAADEFPPPVL